MHAVVARSTFRSQNVESTPAPGHFLEVEMLKRARRCGAKHISKSNVENTPAPDHFWKLRCRKSARRCGAKTFRSQNVESTPGSDHFWKLRCQKKYTPLWREAHFEVKMLKTPGVQTTFGGSDVVSRGGRKGLCTLSRVSKTWGFCSISKSDGRRGAFEEDLQRWIPRGRSSTRDMCIRDVRRPGR